MAQRLLVEDQFVQSVTYTLPNKHYIPVPMQYIGLDNLTPCVVFPSDLRGFSMAFAIGFGFVALFRVWDATYGGGWDARFRRRLEAAGMQMIIVVRASGPGSEVLYFLPDGCWTTPDACLTLGVDPFPCGHHCAWATTILVETISADLSIKCRDCRSLSCSHTGTAVRPVRSSPMPHFRPFEKFEENLLTSWRFFLTSLFSFVVDLFLTC